MIKESSLEAVGRKYNVTGNAVKKWLKNGPVVQLEWDTAYSKHVP